MFGELPALVFGLLSAACVVTTTFWNQWSISSTSSNGLLGPIWAFKYLFGECIQYQAGQFQCQELESQFLIPGYKIFMRALMITSIFLSCLAVVGILLGMQCTRIFEDTPRLKRKIIIASAISYFLTAVFSFTTMTWYTILTYNTFITSSETYIRWELGACIYLGYVASVLSFLTFVLCICYSGPREGSTTSSFKNQPSPLISFRSSSKEKYQKNNVDHRLTDYV